MQIGLVVYVLEWMLNVFQNGIVGCVRIQKRRIQKINIFIPQRRVAYYIKEKHIQSNKTSSSLLRETVGMYFFPVYITPGIVSRKMLARWCSVVRDVVEYFLWWKTVFHEKKPHVIATIGQQKDCIKMINASATRNQSFLMCLFDIS